MLVLGTLQRRVDHALTLVQGFGDLVCSHAQRRVQIKSDVLQDAQLAVGEEIKRDADGGWGWRWLGLGRDWRTGRSMMVALLFSLRPMIRRPDAALVTMQDIADAAEGHAALLLEVETKALCRAQHAGKHRQRHVIRRCAMEFLHDVRQREMVLAFEKMEEGMQRCLGFRTGMKVGMSVRRGRR